MRHLVVLAVLAVVAAVLAALPLAHSQGLLRAGTAPSAWPCCDECGSCTRSIPPQCTCMDVSLSGCHPACKNCVKTFLGGRTVFWCMQRMKNFCERRCTPTGMIN